ncbi:MAG: AraC family transcriptional regulator [Clostridia bacterium]|jgi:predicted transcriptional regulator|nr:AraC family transcriptional regulator [Clostridia bacterium]
MSKLTIKELIRSAEFEIVAGEKGMDNEVEGGYVGDLLSFVMAHAKEKDVWVTIQGHINSVAVASLLGLSAIILSEGVAADSEMIKKADEEGIPILRTKLSSFDVVCKVSGVIRT